MFNSEIMGKRIKKLRGIISQEQCAKGLGISRGALSFYENGDRKPDAELIYKMSKYFGVSSDYLLGLSDIASQDADIQTACKVTGLNENAVLSLAIQSEELKKEWDDKEAFQVRDKIISSNLFYNMLLNCSELLNNSEKSLNICELPVNSELIDGIAKKIGISTHAFWAYIKNTIYSLPIDEKKISQKSHNECDLNRYENFLIVEKISDMFDKRNDYLNYNAEQLIEFLRINKETLKQMREQGDDYGKHHSTEE